ncbi:MAG TPA: ABC transporter substrate-binding protein [Clostridia bacterium]|nr:ABC transporter substrate-binding protein [Clostridia bacterium]
MKRYVNLLVILLFILPLTLSGCGQNEKSSQSSNDQSSSAENSSTQSSITQNSCIQNSSAQDSNTQNSTSLNTPAVTPAEQNGPDDQQEQEATKTPEDKIINVWSYTHELTGIIEKFKELHPNFGYEIKLTDLSNSDISMQTLLDKALAAGGTDMPDIYAVESAYTVKYTKGEASKYAAAYIDLGIDIDKLLREASVAKYVVDLGTNPEGKVVGLGYQSTSGAFVYRRSIAKKVWGTDDPSKIKAIVGPGWDKFLIAAAGLKAKGYRICSSADDIWQVLNMNADQAWVVDGKLFIDPKREAFLDLAMELKEKGYINNTRSWTDAWYKDMNNEGGKKVFGYFGPSWFINYVMVSNSGGKTAGEGTYGDWAICDSPVSFYWGGTWILANKDTREKDGVAEILKWITLDTSETGLQYLWANGKLGYGAKDTVISAAVMKVSDGKNDFLGGQNQFDAFISAGNNTYCRNATKYDERISFYWIEQAHEYMDGKKSREQAIADFKKSATEYIDNVLKGYGS